MTTNDAAERLRERRCNCPESGTSGSCPFHDASTKRLRTLRLLIEDGPTNPVLLDEALAAERRATVERIRAACLAYWPAPAEPPFTGLRRSRA